MFFQLDDNLVQIRRLKEKYIEFNKTEERDLEKINTLLSNIIDCYSHSTLIMFKEFSELLKAHKQEIINSFIPKVTRFNVIAITYIAINIRLSNCNGYVIIMQPTVTNGISANSIEDFSNEISFPLTVLLIIYTAEK